MKKTYIKPETEQVVCNPASMIATSTPKTEWNMGEEGSGNTKPITGDDDPNADAKGSSGLWDDVEEEENW